MDADFSIELGQDDPVLELPWKDPAGRVAYVDLKRQPDLITQIDEARLFPELGRFLQAMNSERSILETAKCDVWATTELSAEEEIYEASCKFASYTDLVFSEVDKRLSFSIHDEFVRKLAELLGRATEMAASAEVCVRRCYSDDAGRVREGFYFTLYVNGFGLDGDGARQNWAAGLKLAADAIEQLSIYSPYGKTRYLRDSGLGTR